jgi:4-hydroxy-3-polyprenylbenzoate decarboxylase
MTARRYVVAMTGASGAPYWKALVQTLLDEGVHVHLVVSYAGSLILKDELGLEVDPARPDPGATFRAGKGKLVCHGIHELDAPISGGLFPTDGMIVCPCSAGRLGSFAAGLSQDLIDRAAMVTLKERRSLVLVPRETPLNTIHLENLVTLSRTGACILPAMPAFYTHPREIGDMVAFLVRKIRAQLPA